MTLTPELQARMDKAALEYLTDAKFQIFEYYVAVVDDFDGSEYQQGKKDGLRIAMAMLGNPEHADLMRGRRNGRPVEKEAAE